MAHSKPVVFFTPRYEHMRREFLTRAACEAGALELTRFPDGERYARIDTRVTGRDVWLVGGTVSDEDTLLLYDLASTLVKDGVCSLTLVVPYYGYATMERAVHAGEVVTAKTRARLLSSIPEGDVPNRVVLLDTHTEGLQHYFEGGVVPVHTSARDAVVNIVDEFVGRRDNLVLACTDAGRAKWVEALANHMGVGASFVFKKRIDGERTEVRAVDAQVRDKDVVIYDDMIRTGSSLIGAARAYKSAGARAIWAVTTHAVLPGASLDKLRDSGLFQAVGATDSHPRAAELEGDFLRVASCVPTLLSAVHRPV